MDATAFRETVERDRRTELDRLGSNKLLVALTGAQLDARSVLAVAADSEENARQTFADWAHDETDDGAAAAFEAVVERERDHRRRVLAAMDDPYEPETGGATHAYLRGLDGTVARIAAGMVGRPLVALETHAQIVSFFINEADSARADLFRELREETESTLERGLGLLDERCETDDHWATACGPAEYVIECAYDEYADALREMGVEPKNVC